MEAGWLGNRPPVSTVVSILWIRMVPSLHRSCCPISCFHNCPSLHDATIFHAFHLSRSSSMVVDIEMQDTLPEKQVWKPRGKHGEGRSKRTRHKILQVPRFSTFSFSLRNVGSSTNSSTIPADSRTFPNTSLLTWALANHYPEFHRGILLHQYIIDFICLLIRQSRVTRILYHW